METKCLPIEEGYLTEAPVFETHKRGKNWMALISNDPKSPGGIGRKFFERGNGKYIYDTSAVELYMPLEFGADYYSGGGNKQACRRYGVVLVKQENRLEIQLCKDATEAIQVARDLRVTSATMESVYGKELEDEERTAK
jgi:hypothetical protein